MGLEEYKKKRKFNSTPEPEGKEENSKGALRFVIQKHAASHLHYDFRLEMDGVLKSWAVPKGPSLNPADKRLSMMVEDHPVEYGSFEGIIPKGNYGAGTVMLWDEGTYFSPGLEEASREENEKALRAGLHKGDLKIVLNGQKLKGAFVLVKTKRESGKGNEWLLIKKKDDYVSDDDVTELNTSVHTGRTMEEIASQSKSGASVWHSSSDHNKLVLDGIPEGSMPHEIKPMMATLVDEPFDNPDWIFEIKWDGFRAIAEVNYNKVNLYSRNLLSFNSQFSPITEALEKLGVKAVFDGEIVVLNKEGFADFTLIQNYKRTGEGTLVYYVFDLLYYEGHDLRNLPLLKRKEILRQVLKDNTVIRYNDHIEAVGKAFYEKAQKNALEGLIAKKASSIYKEGTRGKDWLKIKITQQQEAVIVGYTEPKKSRKNFGSLVLGVYEKGHLVFIGNAGGGFNDKTLAATYKQLQAIKSDKSPLAVVPKLGAKITWVKPELVCQVKFQEWTKDGIFRQPIFLGMRDDKKPTEVTREVGKHAEDIITTERTVQIDYSSQREPVTGKTARKTKGKTKSRKKEKQLAGDSHISLPDSSDLFPSNVVKASIDMGEAQLNFTNLNKVFWPEEGYTKRDLIEYYDRISDLIIPYLKDRPESLRRNPHGITTDGFFQKNSPNHTPAWIKTVNIYSEGIGREIDYLICNDKATLLYMANSGCIEINPWSSRVQSIDNPDYIVIDLDPREIEFKYVIEVAQAVKQVLDKAGIVGYPKTSGSKGIHIYIPLGAKYSYEQGKDFALLIASLTYRLVPEITSLERMPSKRIGKVYLDYLQNIQGQTLAAPYCIRPRKGATVSTPLLWEEIKEGLHPSQFTIKTVFDRIAEVGDLFKPVLTEGIDMETCIAKLQG